MELITFDLLNERVAETARDILDNTPVGERLSVIDEYVEGWDWNIYDYYIDQLFVLAVQRDDRFIEMIKDVSDEPVRIIKALVASAFTCDLVYASLKRMGVCEE